MKKSNPQSAFPILLAAVFIMVFGSGLFAIPAGNLLSRIGNLITTELTSTKISSFYGLNSGIYITEEVRDPNACDWRDGMSYKMHWPQLPDFGITGMDVEATQTILADDFKCTSTGPINDIHFWASFVNDIQPVNEPNSLTFEISIYSDVPISADPWSMPGNILWSRIFIPGEYTVRKIFNRPSDWYDPISLQFFPDNHRLAFQYNFCVAEDPFIQEEGKIYWLSIMEIRPSNATHKLGWKTTTKKLRWNDGAVSSTQAAPAWLPIYYPKEHEYTGQPVNLAFTITDDNQGEPDLGRHDFGDAPDSSNTFPGEIMLAYPDANTTASYPTVFWTSFPPYGPIHWHPKSWFYLGRNVSLESGADYGPDQDINNNLYPPGDLSDRDGADDGLHLPLYLPHCQETSLHYTATFLSPAVSSPVYVNVWCDWNRDGDWDDIIKCSDNNDVPEWAVQNTTILINFAGTVDLPTPSFLCWHPQNDGEPDPMWLRITISEKPWKPTYPNLVGSGGSGPQAGYEYGETEDYLVFPKLDPNSLEYDWADAPDSFIYPAYPTISTNYGANHLITGPWLGDANDKPDAELNGQPDPNALGDDLDIEPLFSLGPPNDDENGVTIPPLIPGYPVDITLEVNGGGGMVQTWIDYDCNSSWESDEQVYNHFLSPGTHVISFKVPYDAVPGQTFARFRISRKGNLDPNGPAPDGEVEDYEVFIEELSPYTKWLQLPDVTPHGIDIQVDSNDALRIIADDFECSSTERITDVHFWGSWKNDKKGEILRIQLNIYGDDPAGVIGSDSENPYSQPDPKLLWQKDFYPGQFSEELYHEVRKPGEWWWDLVNNEFIEGADRQIWRIDIDIDPNEAFTQLGTINDPQIYWLAIRVDTRDGKFGWKTRRWPDHFMDDAVWDVGTELPHFWNELRYPRKHPYSDLERNSIDMAFQLTYMQDPGVQTMRPVSLTRCPAVQTRCPAISTQCPPVNTQCPIANTACPPGNTTCPPLPTQCGAIITVCGGSSETQCPALLTECPTAETQCPSSNTVCPAVETECPSVDTECPVTETACPSAPTECPVVETQCPLDPTICQVETVHPVEPTKCPLEPTRCPSEVTRCPPVDTQCNLE